MKRFPTIAERNAYVNRENPDKRVIRSQSDGEGGWIVYEEGDELPVIPQAPPEPEYMALRRAAYPPIEEQLDIMFHEGFDGWKNKIQAIKNRYPKDAK